MRVTILMILAVFCAALTTTNAQQFDSKQIKSIDDEGRQLYYPNKIYIKIKENVIIDNEKRDRILASGANTLGVESIDIILSNFGKVSINQAFKQSKQLSEKANNRLLASGKALPSLKNIFEISFTIPLNARSLVSSLNENSYVEYAELVPIMYTDAIPNDEKYETMMHLPQIKAPEAWDIHKGEDGKEPVLVGICDTGADWDHQDLLDNLYQNLGEDADGDGTVIVYDPEEEKWVFDPDDENGIDDDNNGYIDDFIGWDFLVDEEDTEGNDPQDVHGHGTHCSGLACGVTNNTEGIASISWNVKFMPTSHSSPSNKHIVKGFEGIVYLADNGCDIINCSWGGGGYSKANQETINYATSLGVIVVCAAGNDNSPAPHYPSSYAKAISVAALGVDDKRAIYSNYGIAIDISAPGGDYSNGGALESTVLKGGYDKYQGTSMASPVAAGLFALVKSYYPEWTADQITKQIIATCDDITEMNPKNPRDLGAGRINAYRALTEEDPQVKQALKLAIDYSYIVDEEGNNDGAANPGEVVNIGFNITNYAKYVSSDKVTFTIQTEDEDVEIINAEVTASIDEDGTTDIGASFQVRISEYTFTKMADMTLVASSEDMEILFGETMEFELPITAGGFLVYDGGTSNAFSGKYIADFLEDNDFHYLYTNTFPSSLLGYDAVFLNFGFHSSNNGLSGSACPDWMADNMIEYLEAGGKLYFEGGDILGFTHAKNERLLSLLGLDSTAEGDDERYLDTMAANSASIMKDMMFTSFAARTVNSIDYLEANEKAVNTFESMSGFSYGVQFENEETSSQSVIATIGLINLNDQSMPSTKYEYVARLLGFFGYEADYVIPQFDVSTESGNAPIDIDFTDKTISTNALTSWEWDLDGDGTIDSEEENPSFNYNEPGVYQAELVVSDGKKTKTISRQIEVFDGECALDLKIWSRTYAKIDTTEIMTLRGAVTFEAWIFPNSLGNYNYGRIFQKGSNIFLLSGANQLRLLLETQDGVADVWSEPNAIFLNKWQHVAVSYDGDSIINMYINGELQTLNNTGAKPAGPIVDSRGDALVIGNRINRDRNFDGRIDEFRVWSKELTEEQIQENMNKNLEMRPDELIGYWQFQEGSGSESEDLTANNDCAVLSKWGFGWLPKLIQDSPDDVEGCLYEFAQFFVNTIGARDTTVYTWRFDGEVIEKNAEKYAGQNTETLTVFDITTDDEGEYSVHVFDPISDEEETSDSGVLTINNPVHIAGQSPNTINMKIGEDYELYVNAEGTDPFEYQWYMNKKELFEETERTLKITSATQEDIGVYFCEVTNICGDMRCQSIFLDMESGVNELDNGQINIYPTIVDNSVTIELNLKTNDKVSVVLYDLAGQKLATLASLNLNQGGNAFVVDIPSDKLAKGTYLLNIIGTSINTNAIIQIAK
jgi:subtilisin family serine protease/PKD repeat protein